MTQNQAQSFLSTYAAAFEDFDAAAICACFNFPLTIVGGAGSVVFQTRAEAMANFEAVNARHRSLGFHRAQLVRCEVASVDAPTLAQVATEWRFLRADGEEIYAFPVTYILGRFPDEWRISVAVNSTG